MKIYRILISIVLCSLLLCGILPRSIVYAKTVTVGLDYEKTGITIDDTFISDPAVGVEYSGNGWRLLTEQTATPGVLAYTIFLHNYNGDAIFVQSAVFDVNLSIVVDGDCAITAPSDCGIFFEYWSTAEYDALNAEYEANLSQYNTLLAQYQTNVASYAEQKALYTTAYAEYSANLQEYNTVRNSYTQAQAQVSTTKTMITETQSLLTMLEERQNGDFSSTEMDDIIKFFQIIYPGINEDIIGSTTTGGLATELAAYAKPILQQYQAELIVQEAELNQLATQLDSMQAQLTQANVTLTSTKQQLDAAEIELTNLYNQLLNYSLELPELEQQLNDMEFKQSISNDSPIACHIYLKQGASLKFTGVEGKSTNAPQPCLFVLPGTTAQQLLTQINCKNSILLNKDGTAVTDQLLSTGMTLSLSDNKVYKIINIADVDGDGAVTSADARLALRAAVGLESYSEDSAEYMAANVDQEAKISSADARLILRAAVGLEDPKNWMH